MHSSPNVNKHDSTYTFLDVLTSALIQCSRHTEDSVYEDEPNFKNSSSPLLSSHANSPLANSRRHEAALPIPTVPEGLRNALSLVSNEKTHEKQLGRLNTAHAICQSSRASSPMDVTGLKQSELGSVQENPAQDIPRPVRKHWLLSHETRPNERKRLVYERA
jgi:hypothetical protein